MEDQRIEAFERDLWVGNGDIYRNALSEDYLLVVPREPFVVSGEEAKSLLEQTPKWDDVRFSDMHISRPEEGLIVIAYRADAHRDPQTYTAYCTTTMRRRGHEDWEILQHQQTVAPGV